MKHVYRFAGVGLYDFSDLGVFFRREEDDGAVVRVWMISTLFGFLCPSRVAVATSNQGPGRIVVSLE